MLVVAQQQTGILKQRLPVKKTSVCVFFREKKIGGLISDFFPIRILIETTIFLFARKRIDRFMVITR